MPNHCFNTLTVHGSPDDVRALEERIDAAGGFHFATFVPVPENVCEGTTGGALLGRDANGAWARVPWIPQPDGTRVPDPSGFSDVAHRTFHTHHDEIVPDEEMAARGLIAWFPWRCEAWGTKWTAYSIDRRGGAEDGYLEIEFDTAWAPPTPVVLAMQAQHPNLSIHLHATEPGMGFQVTVTEDGDVIEEPYEFEDETDDDDADADEAPSVGAASDAAAAATVSA